MITGLAAIVVATLPSCISYIIPGTSIPKNTSRPAWIAQEYGYLKGTIDYTIASIEEHDKFTIKELQFPSATHTTKDNGIVTVSYYQLKSQTSPVKKGPLVILSPILGGDYTASKWFAEFYANRGIATAIVHRPKDRFMDSDNYGEDIEKLLRQPIIDMRRVIDLFETFPEIDKYRIGSLGISMGGIRNATLAGIEPRLKVNVFIMAGVNIPYLLQYSDEPGIREKWDLAIDRVGEEALIADLEEHIKTDPRYFIQYANDSTALVYMPIWDKTVPVNTQKELIASLGNPSIAYLYSGHYSAVIFALPPINYLQRSSLNFFKRKFNELDIPTEVNPPDVTKRQNNENSSP
jgi:hypothetical protein